MENLSLQMKSFLRPSEAAARFHLPLRAIYTWCLLGRITCINVSDGSWRVFVRIPGARESAGRAHVLSSVLWSSSA